MNIERKAISLLSQAVVLSLILLSCNRDCGVNAAACADAVPQEDCMAYFTRWFYNSKENKCEKISYSGCSAKGFATKDECQECKCG
jgi:hypothetical protein